MTLRARLEARFPWLREPDGSLAHSFSEDVTKLRALYDEVSREETGALLLAGGAVVPVVMPPTPPELVEKIRALEARLVGHEPVEVPTEHVFHAGMYARTIAMPAGHVLTGALLKRATLLIVSGSVAVLAGEECLDLEGYNVIRGEAGRKGVFVSRSPVVMTMVFPTSARTVEEAEAEFTDEAAGLLSRRQDANTVIITEE